MRREVEYDDFVLQVGSDHAGGLLVRVIRAPYGGSGAPFRLPYPLEKLDRLLRGLESTLRRSAPQEERSAATRDGRRVAWDAPADVDPTEVGKALFDALFPKPVRECLLQSLARAETRQNAALRVRLHFDVGSPEVAIAAALPWELLYREETRDFLGRNRRTPVVRQLDVPRLRLVPASASELQVLVVVSETADLDAATERHRITEALRARSDIRPQFLIGPTLKNLRVALDSAPIDVLHFIGHGTFVSSTDDGALVLRDRDATVTIVAGSRFAETLKEGPSPRLVVLNACDTGRLPRHRGRDPYTGVATALLLGGIPAVLAMQFPITDAAAISFCDAFYKSVASGDLLETAVTAGRLAIHDSFPGSWEWITPVLYLSLDEGRLLAASAGRVPSQGAGATTARDLCDHGAASLDRRAYTEASRTLYKAIALLPESGDAHFLLALSLLAGRRPHKLSRPEIREIEENLRLATERQPRPDYYLFWAYVKRDYCSRNGLLETAPSADELLRRVVLQDVDAAAATRLLRHLPSLPSDAILRQIAAQANPSKETRDG